MKIWLTSLGCDKNLVDAERMLGVLDACGHVLIDDPAAADVVIINTCCFIDAAKEESIAEILQFAPRRKDGTLAGLIVSGCMAERYREEILREIPEVDMIIGISSLKDIGRAVDALQTKEKQAYLEPMEQPAYALPRFTASPGRTAYLKIADGCNKHCSYCIIPSIRGPYHSVPMEQLLAEANALVAQGYQELILVAQETTLYGVDLYGEKKLPQLLQELCQIEDLVWIRLLYAYPEEIDDALLTVMANEKKICHALDLPIQHASDAILQAMHRATTRAGIEEIIQKIRARIPDIVLRTSLITGFPGETAADHACLLDFIRAMRFDHLGVFLYSQEEGTEAAMMPDQLPEAIKEQRYGELMEAQQLISLEKNQEKIGRTMRCIVEAYLPEEEIYSARTYGDAPDIDGLVFFASQREFLSGDFVDLVITGASAYDLEGELTDESAE